MGNMPAQQQQGFNQGRGMNQGNMPAQQQQQQQPLTQGLGQGQGMDSHSSTEDNYNKSTQEHRSQQQPGFDPNLGQQMGDQEENFSTSTQENKSHKATSHVAPCTTTAAGGAGAGDPMAQNLNTANTAQPLDNSGFGGNAAAGGSSNMNMGMGAGMGAQQDLQGKGPAQGYGQGHGQGQGQGEYTTPRQKYNADADRPVQQQQHMARDQRGGY